MTTNPAPSALTAQPLRLPHLTPSEAQARSALAARVNDCPFDWLGHDWSLTLSPQALAAGAGDAIEPDAHDVQVRVVWGGAPLRLVFPRAALSSWLGGSFPGLDVGSLPPAYLPALIEAACAPLLAQLSALNQGEARIETHADESPAQPMPHEFLWQARRGDQVVRGRLHASALALMMMAGAVAGRPAALNAIGADDLPVRLRAEIGFTWLGSTAVRALQAGDAVLMEHAFISPDREIWLSTGSWGLRAHLGDEGFTVTAAFTEEEFTMSDDDTHADDEQLAGLDAVPLRLTFDLGERQVSLGELRRLQVGESLELGRPLAAAVHLRVNGALVGMGELVDIDGRLGVTISSISPGQSSRAALPVESIEHDDALEDDEHDEDDEADDDWADEATTNA